LRKVAFIIDSLTGGGAERLVLTLAQTMAERGISVTVITMEDTRAYGVNPDVALYSLSRISDRTPTVMRLGRKLKTLFAELEAEESFDLVVVNLTLSSQVARASGLTELHYCINNSLGAQLAHTRQPLVRPWWRHKLKTLYQGQRLICVSRGVAEDIRENLGVTPLSCDVIPNGFDLDRIRELAQETTPEATALTTYVLHVGHFKRQKRLDLLLRAWARVDSDHKLVLLGDGSHRKTENLKRLANRLGIRDRVVLAGWHENAYAWMRQAELLVLSSDFEGFGRVIVEALACGTPVVSTDCPSGPSEILTGDMSRWLVPTGDTQAMAERIQEALDSPPEVDQEPLEAFHIEAVVDQYLALPPRHGKRQDTRQEAGRS